MISVMYKGGFIVNFTFQWWLNSPRMYKRLKKLTLSALTRGPLRCWTHFDKIGQISLKMALGEKC